jgi:hypothetical protein
MGRIEKTVFISYRRANFWTAFAIYQDLTSHGFDAFIDYQNIRSGEFFEDVIFENIRARAHFLIVLSQNTLDRCVETSDLMRQEIETALVEKRNVIPLMMEGFDFGSPNVTHVLTGKLSDLKRKNGLRIYPDFFPEAMECLRKDSLNVEVESIQLHHLNAELIEKTEFLRPRSPKANGKIG